jgi:HAD superfamily hydrolase (TIGR01549 family)
MAAGNVDAVAAMGIVFDVDGTLVDTNYLHVLAWWRAVRRCGETAPMSAIHRLIGMGSDKFVVELLGEDRDDLRSFHSEEFGRLRPEIVAFTEAAALLREVKRRGARVILATSAEQQDLDAMLSAIGAPDAVDQVTSSADVGQTKPAPDIFQRALDASGLEPDAAMALGDSVWDVEAARRTGLRCVCVTTGGISRLELLQAGADAVYDSIGDLLRKLDESPLRGLLR